MAIWRIEGNIFGCYWVALGKRFCNEYTIAPRERMIYGKTKRSSEKLAIGDVVVTKQT